MYSKIKFDIDEDNMPCIVAEIASGGIPIEDVRDKIAKRFKQVFGYESNLCSVEIDDLVSPCRITIKPIPPNNLKAYKQSNSLIYDINHLNWEG